MTTTHRVIVSDALKALRSLPDASVDSIVTDPPYELGFMGKAWDSTGIAYSVDLWREALRVLKPGGHVLSFGGSRTWHRMAVAVEDAGFEIRDSIAWLHSQGMPKTRHVLKPAFEPLVLGRRPFRGTLAANIREIGTGGLNIDPCRIRTDDSLVRPAVMRDDNSVYGKGLGVGSQTEPGGRWPTNVLLDGPQADALDEQSGILTSGKMLAGQARQGKPSGILGEFAPDEVRNDTYGDSGGASRFFPTFRYQAKAPKAERPVVDGVAHPTVKPLGVIRWLVKLVTPPDGVVLDIFAGSGTTAEAALLEGFNSIVIERGVEYVPLIATRLERSGATPTGSLSGRVVMSPVFVIERRAAEVAA